MGAIFVFRAKLSLKTAKKNAILHTFEVIGGRATAPFAPPPPLSYATVYIETRAWARKMHL